MFRNVVVLFVFLSTCGSVLADYAAAPRSAVTLQGTWRRNPAASDAVDRIVAKLLEQDEKERRQWRERMRAADPFGMPAPDDQLTARDRQQQEQELRTMLGVTDTLEVLQEGVRLTLTSDQGTRRFEAGSRLQTSMPDGNLADARIGWDGNWFVIERKVPRRMRQIEKLRLIEKTGQLEYVSQWSGDTELAGVKFRQVFDRVEPSVENSNLGPVH
jgi:hypothetical protein